MNIYNWLQEKLAGLFVFIGMTFLSWKNNVIGTVTTHNNNPYTFEVINTIVKGCINAIFAILVAVIIHFIKVNWTRNKNNKN